MRIEWNWLKTSRKGSQSKQSQTRMRRHDKGLDGKRTEQTHNRSTEQLQIKKGRRRDPRESQPKHLSQASSEKVTVHKKDLGDGAAGEETRQGEEKRRNWGKRGKGYSGQGSWNISLEQAI